MIVKKGVWFLLELSPHDFNWNYGGWILTGTICMENNCNYLKEYADRFIKDNYNSICPKFMAINDHMSPSSYLCAMDRMHDVMISLYETEETFKNYRSFERWAMKKFTQK